MTTDLLLFMILLVVALRIVQAVGDHRETMRKLDAILEALADRDEP